MDQLLGLLLNQVMSGDTVSSVAQSAGVTNQQATSVVSNALPTLVSSLSQTANNQTAQNNLLNLVSQATQTSNQQITSNQNSALGSDLLSTIMGGSSNTNNLVSTVSNNTGVSNKKVNSILTMVAPLLIGGLIKMFMNAKKKQTQQQTLATATQQNTSGINLSDGLDIKDIMGLMSMTSSNNKPANNKPTSGVNLSDGIDLQDILGLVGGLTSTNTSNNKKPSSGVNLSDGLDLNDLLALMINKK